MTIALNILRESWQLLTEASIYILFGIIVGGLLKVFMSPTYVAKHLGQGRFASVFKAALFGIPLPLCSCGVLPAAAALKKQGANNGATTAFLISTPESGVDSIAITYALLDPLMTLARPVAAFCTAMAAGITENLLAPPTQAPPTLNLEYALPGDRGGFRQRIIAGFRFAFGELWHDLAVWFIGGLLLGGMIAVLVPETIMVRYLGGGLHSMLAMLLIGIPLYICATASTPIAAALILKGMSPGTALVFLLVGPATNMASLSMLLGLLGRRATTVYILTIAGFAVVFGLALDQLYDFFNISARAVAGQAAEFIPPLVKTGGGLLLLAMSIQPLYRSLTGWGKKIFHSAPPVCDGGTPPSAGDQPASSNNPPRTRQVKTCDRL